MFDTSAIAEQDVSSIERALAEANLPTLMVVMAQLSGRGIEQFSAQAAPGRGEVDGTAKMPAADQELVRRQALAWLKDLAAGATGRLPLPDSLPDDATLQRLASFYVGEPVPMEYIPMLKQEMGFVQLPIETLAAEAEQIRQEQPVRGAPESAPPPQVAIVGAGLSGLCAAVHLKRVGIPFVILEKNPKVGGTWYENTYPDCGVDTPNHFYSYSFEPNQEWTAFFAKRDEIHAYLEGVAAKYGIYEHIRFDTEVRAASYDDKACQWRLDLRTPQAPDGEQLRVPVLVSAVGQLNRPSVPDFDGKDSFAGESFHATHWRHDLDLSGKRVGVIGTGASAMQLAPAIASQVAELKIFQRSPHWIRVLPEYHKKLGSGKTWLLRHIPFYRNWYRFKLFWNYGDGIWESLHYDPDWPHPERSLNADNQRHREIYVKSLSAALNGDEELIAKVIPEYPVFGKRMLIDNHWCDMLQRSNVQLIPQGVACILPDGLRDAAGDRHELDVIIYATGFKAGQFLWPIEVRGLSGRTLAETWGEDARAYLGMTAPDFPNMFMLYGPNTNVAHGGSVLFHAECQARYIARCLLQMQVSGSRQIEVRRQVHDDYNQRVDAEHNQMVWTHPGVTSWYINSSGRVVANSPWRAVDYWQMTHRPKTEDFHWS